MFWNEFESVSMDTNVDFTRKIRGVFRTEAPKKTEFSRVALRLCFMVVVTITFAKRSRCVSKRISMFFRIVFVKAMVASPAGTEAPKQLTAGFTFAYIYMCVSQ